MKAPFRYARPLACLVVALAAATAHAENIKVAMLDPTSGPFAVAVLNWLKGMRMFAAQVNEQKLAGNNTIEIVPFDNKNSVQESLVLLKVAIDQGYHYVVHSGSSAIAAALIDAVNKNNERNPDKKVVILDPTDADPALTNEKCSFWYFRFDANADMKTEALTTYMAGDKAIKKVYIIGQNYSMGQAVSRAAKEYLKRKRPDVEIVGDDLHPLGQVKDFSPYVAKIKASGADSVITGNYGADLILLARAIHDAGLKVNVFTFQGNSLGVTAAVGSAGVGRLRNLTYYSPNNPGFVGKEIVERFRKDGDDFISLPTYNTIFMFADAIKRAGSADPEKVAFALEGAHFKSLAGDVEMRRSDHQLLEPLYVATLTEVDGKVMKYDQEKTGLGWKLDQKLDLFVSAQPTSCQMARPTPR